MIIIIEILFVNEIGNKDRREKVIIIKIIDKITEEYSNLPRSFGFVYTFFIKCVKISKEN